MVCADHHRKNCLTRTEADKGERVAHLVGSITAVHVVAESQYAFTIVPAKSRELPVTCQFIESSSMEGAIHGDAMRAIEARAPPALDPVREQGAGVEHAKRHFRSSLPGAQADKWERIAHFVCTFAARVRVTKTQLTTVIVPEMRVVPV